MDFPKKYKGSCISFISNYIIPALPKVENVIRLTDSLLDYLEDDNKTRYIRKLKNFNKRSSLYNFGNKKFTVTDNEPALWMYMECFEKKTLSFYEYELKKSFPIALALTPEEKTSDLFKKTFNINKKSREKGFSKKGLKHCHIIDCSPKNYDLDDVTLDQRMLRLLSPMNHFPFPSYKKFEMVKDYGEDISFRNILIKVLSNEYYESETHRDIFKNFLIKCGSNLQPITSEDFSIEYGTKDNLAQTNKTSSKSNSTSIPKQASIKNLEITNSDVFEITKTRFFINERIYRELLKSQSKFFKLNVLPNKGNHPKGFYLIPRNIIIAFIDSKRHNSYNWEKNGNFNQDSIPSTLKGYFTFL